MTVRSLAPYLWHRAALLTDLVELAGGQAHWFGSEDTTGRYTDRTGSGTIQPESGYLPAKMAGDTIRALAAMREPYFVWYSPFLAHSPYRAPPARLHSSPPWGP